MYCAVTGLLVGLEGEGPRGCGEVPYVGWDSQGLYGKDQ
jgi:hypothetical protein